MYDYPDGRVAAPVIATIDSGATDAAELELGADVYFWHLRIVALEAATVVLWRPKVDTADTGTIAEATSYRRALGDGEAWESPMFPANQRPSVIRTLATAGSARVEVVRVVRQ
jgi:hypothetical protein